MGGKLDKGIDAGISVVNMIWAGIFGIGGILMVATGPGLTKLLGLIAIAWALYIAIRIARIWVHRQ